jgi:hypothetical protein
MFHQFNFSGRPPINAFWCQAQTDAAKRFVAKYGEVFTVQEAFTDGGPGVTYNTGTGQTVTVQVRGDGIYVDGKFFAKSWEDEDEEASNV